MYSAYPGKVIIDEREVVDDLRRIAVGAEKEYAAMSDEELLQFIREKD